MASIKGTNKADRLLGTNAADKIQALGGNDTIFGLGGNDTLEGGGGDDVLQGGAGSDIIDGGTGRDTIDYSNWSTGIRVMIGAFRTDTKGNGTVEEYDAAGALVSTDTVSNIENVTGGAGNDYIHGNYAFNVLRGGDGRDNIVGNAGSDAIYGDGGDDLLSAGTGNTFIDGGSGIDTVYWSYPNWYDWHVDLQAGTGSYPRDPQVETLVSIENVRAGSGNDRLLGSDAANVIQGGIGDDVIQGRDGDDLLMGDDGRRDGMRVTTDNDVIDGGNGNDTIIGDVGDDILTGGSGSDLFQFDLQSGHDRITDFESAVDSIALFGGLTIGGWELRDGDGDGTPESQTALLSDGSTILFLGHADVPELSLSSSSAELYYIDLTIWL